VKKIKPNGSNTIYVGGIYEVDKTSGGSVTRTVTYYPGGAMRINSTLYYVLKDHLGSASVVTDSTGAIVGEQRYYPYSETRLSTGSIYTDKLFTGQREMTGLGIYHYGARFYSPKLGRFLSADTIVPGAVNPQNFNRYSYVRNNPIRYTDPTGHTVANEDGGGCYVTNCGLPVPPPPYIPPSSGGGGGGGGNPCTSVVCLPTPTPEIELPPYLPPLGNDEPQITPDILQDAGELYTQWLDILDHGASILIKYPYAPYKYIRAFQFNPFQEALISASLQVVADGNNQLTLGQRGGRGLWAGVEAGLIDVITAPVIVGSTAAGALIGAPTDGFLPIGEAGGAFGGYVIGALASNSVLVNASETWATPWIYNTFNLYDPNGN